MAHSRPPPAGSGRGTSSDARGAGELLIQCSLTTLALVGILTGGLISWTLGQILLAVAILRWFFLLHSCGHRSLFRTRRWNDLTGLLASAFCLVPYHPWRHTHRLHHRYPMVPGKDPTAVVPEQLAKIPLWRWAWAERAWAWNIPVIAPSFLVGKLWRFPVSDGGDRIRLKEARISILAIVSVHAVTAAVAGASLYLSILPAVGLVLLVSDILLLSQHYGPGTDEPTEGAGQEAAAPTRSLRFPPPVEAFVMLRFNRHTAHHRDPGIPHYRLPYVDPESAHGMYWWDWVHLAKSLSLREIFLGHTADLGGHP